MSTRRGFQTCPYVRGSIGIMEGRDGRFANRPYEEGGRMDGGRVALRDWGMDSRLRLHGGRLCAGTTGGDVGMREGEHEKGQVSNLPLREGKYRYYVGRDGRFANRPYGEGGMDGGRMALRAGLGDGFPPSSSRGQVWEQRVGVGGQDWGMDSRLRLHGGRLCAGTTSGDVGMRGEGEHEKGQV